MVAMLATACIYPYNPVSTELSERLVIEGDILIGSTTDVLISYVMPLTGTTNPTQPICEVSVECSDGSVYPATRMVDKVQNKVKNSHYVVDSKDFSPECEYRLCVKNTENDRVYHSAWTEVQTAPQIDSLGYIINDDRTNMDITISLTATDSQKYYRWTFYEEWEYTSLHRANIYCIPGDRSARHPQDTVAVMMDFKGNDNNYYCWNNASSDGILLGTSVGLNDHKLVDHKFASISCYDLRVNFLYRMTVTLQAIAQDGYDYWSNLDVISNLSGSFDSPNPSVMAGNIRNDDDPNEFVVGYINVSQVSTCQRYISNYDTNFYNRKNQLKYSDPQEVEEDMWNTYFLDKYYRPYEKMMISPGVYSYKWDYAPCVDCALMGGSKDKRPEDWPNEHR